MAGAAADHDELLARAARFLRPVDAGDVESGYGRVAVAGDAWLRERAGRYLRGGLPELPLDGDGMVAALIAALAELDVEAAGLRRAFDPAKHPRNPKGSPGGGRFRSMVDRLKDAIAEHRKGDGKGDPFAGFDREQLRRVARARGIELKRGEGRESIAQKLLEHLGDAKPGGAGGGPAAKPRLVQLRPETHKAVAAAVKVLPTSDDEWRDVVQDRRERMRITELLGDARRAYTNALQNRTSSQSTWVALVGRTDSRVDSWARLEQFHPDLAREWETHDGAVLNRDLQAAKDRLAEVRDAYDEATDQIAALGGMKPDGSLPDGFKPPKGFHADDFRTVVSWQLKSYPRDLGGVELPPPELVKMHQAVQAAGAAIHADIARSIAGDLELQRMRAQRDEANRIRFDMTVRGPERSSAGVQAVRLNREVALREREYITDALDQLRPMGGRKLTNVSPLSAAQVSALPNVGLTKTLNPARADWEAHLDETAAHMPDDWVRRANSVEMQVVSSDRAFHQSFGPDWRRPAPGEPMLLAMSDETTSGSYYGGSFGSLAAEVTMHETGHHMEAIIPGLKAMEFAYVRSKTTHGGIVEKTVRLKDELGGGYRSDELAYRDQFPDVYTGKTYENGDPANSSWEAFQMGLQQTFGRSAVKYGDDSLEQFVIGAMATLGRY